MKKFIKHLLGIAMITITFGLTSCESSSSSVKGQSRSVYHYHHNMNRGWDNSNYYERDIIIIDDVDPYYDIGVPEAGVLPELDE